MSALDGWQIGSDNSKVFIFDSADGLQLYHDLIFDEEVEAVFADPCIAIEDRDGELLVKDHAPMLQLEHECAFADGFQEAGTERLLDFDRRSEDLPSDVFELECPAFPAFLPS